MSYTPFSITLPWYKQEKTETAGTALNPRRLPHLGGDSLMAMCISQAYSCTFRNKDFQEVTLEREGQVLLRFAVAYGFRNIQNLVQKLKRGRCPYHYVEVMACPSGSSS